MSASNCRKACAKSEKCKGYETNKGGRCELHEKRLTKVDSNKAFNCYNKGKDKGTDEDESSEGGDSSSDEDGDEQKWEHVGNGACRRKHGGNLKGTYEKIADKGMSASNCRKACAASEKCKGYETNKGGRCELHEKRLTKVDSNKAFNCYNKGRDKAKDEDESSEGGDSSSDEDGDEQKWEHVGNGACRRKHGDTGIYYKIAGKGMSANDCRKA